jgi:putative tryptophan/tyrosine transport system substrate-binding protein
MDHRLTRRQVVQGAGVAGLGLLAGCGRWPGQAALAEKIPRVGVLSAGGPVSAYTVDHLRQGLRELGYVDGQNLIVEQRANEGQVQRLAGHATELVNLPVDVLVATGPAIEAARQATSLIPIVMVYANDPVRSGWVGSVARPGGNLTGTAASPVDARLFGKRLELLTGVSAGIRTVVTLSSDYTSSFIQEIETAAGLLGIQVHVVDLGATVEFEEALQAIRGHTPDALLIMPSPATAFHQTDLARFATSQHLPAMSDRREFTEDGGLMAYGANLAGQWHRAAFYVDRLLKGIKPADLPIEQARAFDFVVNLKTARALGITFPNEILLQVTEVIQ